MSLKLEQKQAVVAEVSKELAKAQAVILAEYRSVPVKDMTELRRKARGVGVYLRVLKNTLARRAVAETPFKGLTDKMVGPLAYGISAELAKMPSRQELLTKLVATMQAPIAKFVRTLNEVPGKFARTLAAVRDQKEKQAA